MTLKELRDTLSLMLADENSTVVAADENWEDAGIITEVADGSCEPDLADNVIYLRYVPAQKL